MARNDMLKKHNKKVQAAIHYFNVQLGATRTPQQTHTGHQQTVSKKLINSCINWTVVIGCALVSVPDCLDVPSPNFLLTAHSIEAAHDDTRQIVDLVLRIKVVCAERLAIHFVCVAE